MMLVAFSSLTMSNKSNILLRIFVFWLSFFFFRFCNNEIVKLLLALGFLSAFHEMNSSIQHLTITHHLLLIFLQLNVYSPVIPVAVVSLSVL